MIVSVFQVSDILATGILATGHKKHFQLCPAEILLAQHGFARAHEPAVADVILLNTCAIR